ncbi:MAG: ribulose-phosphate 3-epimerase [Clostridia bacterium]|nr:ribulose-phosphate 3-epimerase [Clostridia bacterium]
MLIAPSILAADPLNLGRDARRMVEAGCDWLHVDVMDAHFVPNLSFGPDTVAALHRAFPEVPLDVHLMMDNPEAYLRRFAEAGAAGITVHAEVPGDPAALLREIRALGCRPGLSLKPATPVEAAAPYLPLCGLVLVMTVEPGFGGQAFMPEMAEKLPRLRQAGFAGLTEADGGLRPDNLPLLVRKGLDVAVMGTALLHAASPAEDMAAIRRLGA